MQKLPVNSALMSIGIERDSTVDAVLLKVQKYYERRTGQVISIEDLQTIVSSAFWLVPAIVHGWGAYKVPRIGVFMPKPAMREKDETLYNLENKFVLLSNKFVEGEDLFERIERITNEKKEEKIKKEIEIAEKRLAKKAKAEAKKLKASTPKVKKREITKVNFSLKTNETNELHSEMQSSQNSEQNC